MAFHRGSTRKRSAEIRGESASIRDELPLPCEALIVGDQLNAREAVSGEHRSRSVILWQRLDMPGHEVAELTALDTGWLLSGVAVLAHEGRPCRMEYDIQCDAAWRTRTLTIRGHVGGVPSQLELARNDDSAWTANGAPVPALLGCIDVDLGFSPSTNLLPIRRLELAVGDHAPVRAAWVRFPELTLAVLEQVYTRTGSASYRYESAGGTFRRELTVNADGFVLDYPDFWRAEASGMVGPLQEERV